MHVHGHVETMNATTNVDSNPTRKDVDHAETIVEEHHVEPHVESNNDTHVEPNVETSILISSEPQANPSTISIVEQTINTPFFDTFLDNILNEDLSDKDPQNEEPIFKVQGMKKLMVVKWLGNTYNDGYMIIFRYRVIVSMLLLTTCM